MPIRESLSRAAAVAKWKADQQMRLLRSQNQVRELERQIASLRTRLADTALTLYAQERLVQDELKEIGDAIARVHEQIRQQQVLQEAIGNERPPDQIGVETLQSPVEQPAASKGGRLVCPECGRIVSVRFCPEHGVEGIPVP